MKTYPFRSTSVTPKPSEQRTGGWGEPHKQAIDKKDRIGWGKEE